MKLYVNASAAPGGDGSQTRPFNTIQAAADIAVAGDEVLVMPGVYRENVSPKHGGTEQDRIVYRSVEPRKAVIAGAEPLKGWHNESGNVWSVRVSNAVFTERNPYTTRISGDWFIADFVAHTGDVYMNGKSLYEATSLDAVRNPQPYPNSWDSEYSIHVWYAEQDAQTDETVFYANFQGKDPNEEKVEFSVRSACFAPREQGIGYITLSGFTVCQAATQWAPPTAFQEGMIAPHWSKGWIIEDCEIYESKCCGISLGKYLQKNNDNKWLHWKYKDGTQTERECICLVQAEGWSKETIGSHTVRRCDIHDCGQTGIVGHLGGVFSTIEDNHIHRINNKQNLAGAEIGGIKMHAAIDVIIRRNHIHHCTRGIWLDWQAQGTRVTGNLFHDNTAPHLTETPKDLNPSLFSGIGEDVFVEVSHGPTLIDNNILLSERAIKLACQGVAVVHNLIAGSLVDIGIGTNNGTLSLDSPRYTPYHLPHRTEVAGFMTFLHGDARFYNNLFVQRPLRPALKPVMEMMGSDGSGWDDGNAIVGTCAYDGFQTFEEWDKEFEGYKEDKHMEMIKLSNGVQMPLEGFGVFQVPDPAVCKQAVLDAVRSGYRLIDTAALYMNEEAVGAAIREAIETGMVTREELFITTKLWTSDASYEGAKKAFERSIRKLGLDYLDMFMIHQPYGDVYGAWKAMVELYNEGKIKALGVANFYPGKFTEFAEIVEVKPHVNQIELHPFYAQYDAIDNMRQYGTVPQAWGPLAEGKHGIFTHPVLSEIGAKYGKTAAQIALKWNAQRGVSIIPKSVHKERMEQNIDIWDFTLTDEDMKKVDALDLGHSEIIDHNNPAVVKYILSATADA